MVGDDDFLFGDYAISGFLRYACTKFVLCRLVIPKLAQPVILLPPPQIDEYQLLLIYPRDGGRA